MITSYLKAAVKPLFKSNTLSEARTKFFRYFKILLLAYKINMNKICLTDFFTFPFYFYFLYAVKRYFRPTIMFSSIADSED